MPAAQLVLEPRPPFDFEQTLAVLRGFQADGTPKEVRGGRLRQGMRVGARAMLVELEATGTTERPKLEGRLLSAEPLSEATRLAAAEQLRFYLSLDDELEPFYALAARDAAFAPVVERLYGYHPVKFPSLFSCMCWALVTQRTPNPFAFKTMAQLTGRLGEKVAGHDGFATFPTPQALLAPKARAQVLAATNNTRKTERLLPLARRMLSADEAFLRAAPYDEAYRWLLSLPGIGPWSAEYILLRGLDRLERTPWRDTWLLDGLSQLYSGGLQLSRGDARRLAEGYGWYQGYWVVYLKRFLW